MTSPQPISTASMHRLGDNTWFAVVNDCHHAIGPDTMTRVDASMHQHMATCPDLPGNQTPTADASEDPDGDSASVELHNLIVRRIHLADCGCKSEVHPPEQWEYFSRLADAVTPLFLPRLEWGVLLTGRDSSQDVVWECDDREEAEDTAQKLSGYPVVVHRLGARLVGQEWTEAQR